LTAITVSTAISEMWMQIIRLKGRTIPVIEPNSGARIPAQRLFSFELQRWKAQRGIAPPL